MRNRRRNRRNVRENFENLSSGRTRKNSGFGQLVKPDDSARIDFGGDNFNGDTSVEDVETFRGNLKSSIRGEFDSQVDSIQTAANDRADAEESNLDILDRGSRFIRRSDKLKKFKV